jgi:L-lactate dehydrogenase complex protein LldG
VSVSETEKALMARLRGLGSRKDPAQLNAELAELRSTPPVLVGALGEVFLGKLTANGATTEKVSDRSAAVQAIAAEISRRQPQRRFVTGHDPRLAAMPWRDAGLLPRFGAASADDRVAVSYARCGIAETGTLCLWVDRNNPALNNLLCEHHIVLVDGSTLRESLDSVWDERELREPGAGPRGIMLVAGPSSTADIAMELVLGAHGPRSLHVILLETDPAG